MNLESDSDEENWIELENESEEYKCLFCVSTSFSTEAAIEHLKISHDFDLSILKAKFSMDQYSYIKMINYIRYNKSNANEIQNAEKCLWNDEKYLKPITYEPWLTLDFEQIEGRKFESGNEVKNSEEYSEMITEIKTLKEMLHDKDKLIEELKTSLTNMQHGVRILLKNDEQISNNGLMNSSVGSINPKWDTGYFSSYSHYGIHHDMLKDEVRTNSYRDALFSNKNIIEDKTVLDVGCGTGILSMFASQACAERVVSVDNSDIIYHAMEIISKNNFTNVEFKKGRLEETILPIDKFDVIISEWMGYFLFFEGMLDTIIYARDTHLKSDGVLIPNRCNISLVGYGDESRHKDYIDFWNNVYGFDMSCIQKDVLQEAVIEQCSAEFVLTDAFIIGDFNLYTVDKNYSNFSCDFKLKVMKSGKIIAFVGYFDTFFELLNKISFSTSPASKPTHWKQTVFYIKNPKEVILGDYINGKISCNRNYKDIRSLTVKLQVFDETYIYSLD